MSFTYIDLFAGCGGLSLGLESQGGELLVAVERSPMAGETFFHNLIQPIESAEKWREYLNLDVSIQAMKGLVVKELEKLLADKVTVAKLAESLPDVIVGGPPCQGFSLAGRRNPEDSRNSLPWQFLELVEQTRPKIVVIENVVGMRHKFGNEEIHVFDQLQIALRETQPGYVVQAVEVNALHYGAPQHRPRLMIIGLRTDIAELKKISSTESLWRSNFTDLLGETPPELAPIPTALSTKKPSVKDAIADLASGANGLKKPAIKEYSDNWGVLRNPAKSTLTNHVIRSHQPLSTTRFRLYQILAENGIEAKFLSQYTRALEGAKKEMLARLENEMNFPAVSPDGFTIARNIIELAKVLELAHTKKHSQREPRTFTVRELARFQGFPDGFEFRAKETTGGLNRRNEVPQYSQVGNAVSPFLSRAVGKMISEILALPCEN
jgi:DNA (cytosine-5)-methyltransferase 1